MSRARPILVVDDHLHIRRLAEAVLSAKGYHVIQACDGREGLELILSQKPVVVITDINMPYIDGRELCERTNGSKADSPFLTVVMTARIESNENAWIHDLQDTMFMEKPFSPMHLLAVVEHYLKEHSDE